MFIVTHIKSLIKCLLDFREEALDAGLTQFVIDPAAGTVFPHDEVCNIII